MKYMNTKPLEDAVSVFWKENFCKTWGFDEKDIDGVLKEDLDIPFRIYIQLSLILKIELNDWIIFWPK